MKRLAKLWTATLLTAAAIGCASAPSPKSSNPLVSEERSALEAVAAAYPDEMRLALARAEHKRREGARNVLLEESESSPMQTLIADLFPNGEVPERNPMKDPFPDRMESMIDALIDLGVEYPASREAKLAKALVDDLHPGLLCDRTRELFEQEEFLGVFDTTNYQAISGQVERLLDAYPYHDCVKDARRLLADSLMRRGRFAEARFKYEEYQVLYPNDRRIDEVEFGVAECHFQEISRELFSDDVALGRDPTPIEQAEAHFKRFLLRHPQSSLAEKGRERYAECRQAAAQSRLEISALYLRRGEPQAALVRLDEVIERFSDTLQAFEARLTRIEIMDRLGEPERAQTELRRLLALAPPEPYLGAAKRLQSRLESDDSSKEDLDEEI